MTIRNARGKGAGHVVNYAIGQTRNAAYDYKLALLDADVDWTPAVQKTAKQARVEVIACEPCLEALLLRAHGPLRDGLASKELKRQFRSQFGFAADEQRVYEERFGDELLKQARERLSDLDRLVRAFGVRA